MFLNVEMSTIYTRIKGDQGEALRIFIFSSHSQQRGLAFEMMRFEISSCVQFLSLMLVFLCYYEMCLSAISSKLVCWDDEWNSKKNNATFSSYPTTKLLLSCCHHLSSKDKIFTETFRNIYKHLAISPSCRAENDAI